MLRCFNEAANLLMWLYKVKMSDVWVQTGHKLVSRLKIIYCMQPTPPSWHFLHFGWSIDLRLYAGTLNTRQADAKEYTKGARKAVFLSRNLTNLFKCSLKVVSTLDFDSSGKCLWPHVETRKAPAEFL